ncbi:unnamed protein product [Rhizoctonia solani]|uniref:Uncharacterized protein n=1 Tax=Rhizoctonia solani TaxID=456999 RepID=A0A8H3E7K8_9AGAM|nr:unnamed protein product [Rhizoctonia solani]
MPSSPRPPYVQSSRMSYRTSNVAPAMASPITVNSHRNATLVHRGFYDLLSLVPGTAGVGVGTRRGQLNTMWPNDELVAGQRYEDIPARRPAPAPPPGGTYTRPAGVPVSPPRAQEPTSPKGKRRISKDMVSQPMGFVHLVHASDADQAEALLSRWGPDGIGKLGDPNWAQPIKTRIRSRQQERAIAEVMHAMDATPSTSSAGAPVLHVVNGMSVSTITTSTVAPSTPGAEKTYSRLANPNSRLGLGPPLETQHEHSGEGSTDAKVGHAPEGSEVTIKGRSIVPAPPRQAQATVSPDLGQVEMVSIPLVRREGVGIGYPIGPRSPGSPPQPRSPGRINVPPRSPDRPTGPRSPRMMYPFTSTLIYNRPSDFKSTDDIQYEFRTGSQFAVVNLGSPAAPNSQVVVSQHKTIKDRIFDKDYGAWSVTPISSARASSRRSRGSDASIGAADV